MIKLLSNTGELFMKKRFHLLIIIGVLLIGFIVGSFLDLQIDQALFNKNNGFGLFMASFGVYPCYAGLAFIGGGFLVTTLRRKEMPLWGKIICYAVSALAYGMSIYLCGKEMPSPNGYNNKDLTIIAYAIPAVLFAGAFFGGFMVCRKGDAKQLWVILLIMSVIFVVALLPAGFAIKLIIHRPRYRYLVRTGYLDFYNWWQLFPEYKQYISTAEHPIVLEGFEITKEEFKSFPSGHSGTGMILAMYLPFIPYFFPKLKGKETLLFYCGVAFGLLMMFSRLLVGAHYLTDTCMGSLIVMVVFYVVNEIALRKGWFDLKQPKEGEEPVD